MMENIGWWILALSVLTFVGSTFLLPLLLVWIPPDYFIATRPQVELWKHQHPALRLVLLLAKNLLGLILFVGGLVMLLTPGPGVIALLLGMSLLNFPGKLELQRWLVGRGAIHRSINALRVKAGRPPLELPAKSDKV